MRRTIEYGSAARRDLLGILAYYDERSDSAGNFFLADLDECTDLLQRFPHTGQEVPGRVCGLRKVRFCRVSSRFSYQLIFYAVRSREILIVRIVHGARDRLIALNSR